MKKKAQIRVSDKTLQDLRASLSSLPPKPKTEHCARDTVKALSAEILHATTLGYSFADIAEHYREHGVEISPGTLASYLREMKPAKAKKTPIKARKHAQPDVNRLPTSSVASAMPTLPRKDQAEDDHLIKTLLVRDDR